MRKIIALTSSILFLTIISVKAAEMQYGFGVMTGQISADGSETEGTAADTSARSKSFEEFFVGGDIFMESVDDSGFTVGLSFVPVKIEIGDGQRTDVNTSADIAAEADTGTRKAKANVTLLTTLYSNLPIGGNGWYGLLGGHFARIETQETLNESSYPDEDIFGYQVGFGKRNNKFKVELAYSDFEDISISSTGGGTNTVNADADALMMRLSFGF